MSTYPRLPARRRNYRTLSLPAAIAILLFVLAYYALILTALIAGTVLLCRAAF